MVLIEERDTPGERRALHDEEEQRQTHGELGEEVVIGDGESEMQAVDR